jgi:hypothetical protein
MVHGVGVFVLVWVLVWSGLAKLRDPSGAAQAMVGFRLIRKATPRWGSIASLIELVLAGALVLSLVAGPTAMLRSFLTATALLLVGFSFLIGRSLWRGESFACYCFGRSDAPVTLRAFARAISLSILSAVLAFVGPPSSNSYGGVVLESAAAAAAIGVTVSLALLAQVAKSSRRLSQVEEY